MSLFFLAFIAFGYGLICSPSVLASADYFTDNYGLANGIAFSGVSIGQLIFPPISVEFIYWFGGWRGAMFIFSAILLNIAVCGALLRPLKHSKSNRISKSKPKSIAVHVIPSATDFNTNMTFDLKDEIDIVRGIQNACGYPTTGSLPETDSSSTITYDLNTGFVDNYVSSGSCNKHSDRELPIPLDTEQPILKMTDTTIGDEPQYLKSETQSVMSSTQLGGTLRRYLHKLRAILKSIIMFIATCYGIPGVFLSPLFVIMIPAIFCVAVGWYTTVTHQAARAISDGLSEEDASLLLSLMGIGSLIGRVGHGWFIDRGFLTSETCLVVSLAVCSVFTYLVPVARFFPILCITATIQGLTAGIANTLMTIMIKIMVKPSYEDAAVGMLYLFWGFGDLTGGVVSGE